MIGRLGAILFLALTFASPATGQQAASDANPVWLELPDARTFAQHYPDAARVQYVEGRATVECEVMLDATTRCAVVAETPEGWGFGNATLRAAQSFRVRPATVNGQPVEGSMVRRTIRWVLPQHNTDYRPRFEGLDPDMQTFLDNMPIIDLPAWEEAPNFYTSLDAYPPEARRTRIAGRGVLSCRVLETRRISCELVTETPAGMGFGEAALSLQNQFRVSEGNVAFIARHRDAPFLLPITFSSSAEAMPVNRSYLGVGVLDMPPITLPFRAFDQPGVEGSAVILCTARQVPPPDCIIESETPEGWGFAAFAVESLTDAEFGPDDTGWVLPGDQVRFTIRSERVN